MKKLDVGYSELLNSYKALYEAYERNGGPYGCLLLFYSIECGLKYLLIKPVSGGRSRRTWLEYDKENEFGHNLNRLKNALKIPKHKVPDSPLMKTQRDGELIEIETVHQAWRYGVQLTEETEELIVKWLQRLRNYIEEKNK